ncbi:type III-B CRISPR module RAMP protein Cmr4 [Pelotomaculum sp. PtaB.Bin117]|uniref:type III-B CRISPR module RAMP protein Cmr4 n=1 Tax=Pelotomaculum sp. PtaB.Bin117 TaxID=1811694 RepID=UPI0009CA3E65|nr:type III-B CRISPR module RAMP protein Cmr4 [Pelotomaculum sp. PtaB.Bin117]OPX87185.1 MAG: RAMP superfamily protein [Pelotomaculum sp. PtaB.Bin117]
MSAIILGLLAETSLHPGSESSGGVVDLPVAREATTSYPVLISSGLKGAMRDAYETECRRRAIEDKTDLIFGAPDGAGGISLTDGRLLLLPVRSLNTNYRWVTCPYVLERFQRDLQLAGFKQEFGLPQLKKAQAIAVGSKNLYLEELSFAVSQDEKTIEIVAEAIKPLVLHQAVQKRLVNQLVIVSDDDFKYFAGSGLPVNARNVLDKKRKTSTNLWYEEIIPADSLFYTLLLPRLGKEALLPELLGMFDDHPYLQIGGNETIGQGWCAVSCWKGGQANG